MLPSGKDDPFHFFPVYVADMNVSGSTTTFTEGTCFQKMVFTYNTFVDEATGLIANVTLQIDASRPRSLFCKDWFFIGNDDVQHVETISSSGSHVLTFTNID